ncbi:hypothetical protein CFC21_046812 [Triticum aestivum]|uniref:Topoisomerase 6 subunit A/Spo11 TOPRIM domain-containing protein n=2 Tax=Triticum aestivum TaxID=4565 RepID=A0A9R1K062_WHEAT|nr:DNA topoisomerase 6 subunit A3-like [Triticum aestivum]KAF7036054.1 hypothetical protein CFC21_046812 [Triticum aestivum]
MAAAEETAVGTAAEGSDLRSFFSTRGVAADLAALDDQTLKALDEKYIIARDLDAATVLSKIHHLVGHSEASIVPYEGLSYQLPCRDPGQHEYDPTLRQLCLRRGKVETCTVGDPRTSRKAEIITATLSLVKKTVLSGHRSFSDGLRYGDEVFKQDKKTVDDALLDICCLLECPRASLKMLELGPGTVVGPLIFTMEDGAENHCRSFGPSGARVHEGISNITVEQGATVNFILLVQRDDVFWDFARSQLRHELNCVVMTGGDGEPNVMTRAFLRKLKDCLSVPVYALTDSDPEGISIFCTYKFGSAEMPFDNVGLTIPDIKLIAYIGDDALHLSHLQPLAKRDRSILKGLCAQKHVIGDEQLRENIHFMMNRGLKCKIEALYYLQYPPTDYIRKAVGNLEDI